MTDAIDGGRRRMTGQVAELQTHYQRAIAVYEQSQRDYKALVSALPEA